MFYDASMRAEYREEPCKVALNRVKGMAFTWSLNPYMGCVHRCTFCYVRAFELRAYRPSDARYGTSIRVKVNVAEVLRRELARPSWRRLGEHALSEARDARALPRLPRERLARAPAGVRTPLRSSRLPAAIRVGARARHGPTARAGGRRP